MNQSRGSTHLPDVEEGREIKQKRTEEEDHSATSEPSSVSYSEDEGKEVSFADGAKQGTKASNRRNIFRRNENISDYEEHLGGDRQYWRDIILGVNDGLVSTFLLVAGVTGAHLSNTDILLTAVSGTIAGAISMAAGEYVATKTQQEVIDGEVRLETKHIKNNRAAELDELREELEKIGIPEVSDDEEVNTLRRQLLAYYAKNDGAHLKVHVVLELGEIEEEKRNPFIAGTVAFFLFLIGAMPTVIPFAATSDTQAAFISAAVATTLGLLLVGAIKTWATRGSLVSASMENLVIAAGGGAIAYGVGVGFEQLVNRN